MPLQWCHTRRARAQEEPSSAMYRGIAYAIPAPASLIFLAAPGIDRTGTPRPATKHPSSPNPKSIITGNDAAGRMRARPSAQQPPASAAAIDGTSGRPAAAATASTRRPGHVRLRLELEGGPADACITGPRGRWGCEQGGAKDCTNRSLKRPESYILTHNPLKYKNTHRRGPPPPSPPVAGGPSSGSGRARAGCGAAGSRGGGAWRGGIRGRRTSGSWR